MTPQRNFDTMTESSGVRCPTCNKDLETEAGMKSHHKKVHGDSIAGKLVDCANCGDSVRKIPAHVRKYENHFCSDECMSEFRKSRVRLECSYCEEEFSVVPSRLDEGRKYCSRECFCKNEKEIRRETVQCAQCGEEKEIWKSMINRRDKHFCNKQCEGEWISENRTGENNPRYVEGGRYYGENWQKARRAALERDGHECIECGKGREEQYAKTGRDLNVHHITPIRKFDNPSNANGLENLETLCSKCHFEKDEAMRKNLEEQDVYDPTEEF